MAYSELIKKFEKIRDYIRRFYVYGFWHRDQFDMKSARSYDNEKRRVESWLADYVSFRQEASGKVVFLSVDGRAVQHNPLYKVFKAKSFTANDITLHFYLMDILANGEVLSIKEILKRITEEYFSELKNFHVIDESTLRKKLKEYEKIGLVKVEKRGRGILYQRDDAKISLDAWAEALEFYTEADPMGVIGSFLLDKLPENSVDFRFKHHFLLYALDSEVLCSILMAINDNDDVRLKINSINKQVSEFIVHPMKIYISTQNGRQYLLAWDNMNDRPWFYRLDNIMKVEQVKTEIEWDDEKRFEQLKSKIWGVSLGNYENLEHLEMTIFVGRYEEFIVQRLEREKRGGRVERISDNEYRFSIDVYDTKEMLPWIRTFIGRIMELKCSNPEVEDRFYQDLKILYEWYGGEDDVVQ